MILMEGKLIKDPIDNKGILLGAEYHTCSTKIQLSEDTNVKVMATDEQATILARYKAGDSIQFIAVPNDAIENSVTIFGLRILFISTNNEDLMKKHDEFLAQFV